MRDPKAHERKQTDYAEQLKTNKNSSAFAPLPQKSLRLTYSTSNHQLADKHDEIRHFIQHICSESIKQ